MTNGSNAVSSEHSPREKDARILRFQPRGVPRWRMAAGRLPQPDTPADDLAKFERGDGEEDYRHRMRVNAIALVATVMLVFAGVWLAIRISEMVRIQDCVLSGKRTCAPIEAGAIGRG